MGGRGLRERWSAWLERWSQRRAEKNRRFKIPCHLTSDPDHPPPGDDPGAGQAPREDGGRGAR
ncbi:hypothetical protein C9E82_18410 [Paracoccus siganidrum]|nr:hypothetical protein C9E82_18410 [Paracoccus siganidrum]